MNYHLISEFLQADFNLSSLMKFENNFFRFNSEKILYFHPKLELVQAGTKIPPHAKIQLCGTHYSLGFINMPYIPADSKAHAFL